MTFLPHKPVLVLVLLKNSSSWLLRRWSLVCCPDHKSEESIARVASRASNICERFWRKLGSLRHDVQAGARVLSCVFVGTYVLALASRNSKPDDKQDKSITIRLTTCFQLHLSILLTHSVTNTQTHSHRSPQQTVWPPHTSRLSEPPGRPCYRSGWSPGNSRTVTRRAISQVG